MIQVLIVDNDPAIVKTAATLLTSEGYGVTTVSRGEEALSLFSKKPFEVAVIEVGLPDTSGLDVMQEVKRQSRETQVIVMTNDASLETAITAIRAGAYDYLAKPFDQQSVISASVGRARDKIRLTREHTRLVNDLKRATDNIEKANNRLQELVIRDGLTGLHNHRYVQEMLSKEVKRSRRDSGVFSMIFIDVDHFKHYNDSHGHQQGDRLLRGIAQYFSTCFRKTDTVARYGGEEFMVVLPETHKPEAFQLAEKVRTRIEITPFPGIETMPSGRITVSLGVASFPEDGADADTLTKNADNALYMAKQQGRNRTCKA